MRIVGITVFSVAAIGFCGLTWAPDTPPPTKLTAKATANREAVAVIEARSGSQVKGKAVFTSDQGKVTLQVTVENAEPGTHAVHLHEKGDCSAPDAASAGGHWNPSTENHGKWGTTPFHHGDIGNLEVGADGKGSMTMSTDLWTIGGPPSSNVIGHAVVVHAKADDFTTQPTGNAGGRIGCGVIELKP